MWSIRTRVLAALFFSLVTVSVLTPTLGATDEDYNMCEEWMEMNPGVGVRAKHGFQAVGACYTGSPIAKHGISPGVWGTCSSEHTLCPS